MGYPQAVDPRLLSTVTRALRVVTSAALALVVLAQVCVHVGLALSERGLALASGCLSDRLGLGWWGTHLAMVRVSPDCPDGTFALGADPAVAAGVVVSVALPALLAHLLALLAGVGTMSAARSAFVAVQRLLGRAALRALPRPVRLPDAELRPRVARPGPDRVPPAPRLALVPVRRGPPRVVLV